MRRERRRMEGAPVACDGSPGGIESEQRVLLGGSVGRRIGSFE